MTSVILLMAGSGTRMKSKENKILMELNNKPIFMYSLEKFLKYDLEVVCVIRECDKDYILPMLPKNVKYTIGGLTRGESVYNGLKSVTGDYVLIHDAARPFIADSVIDEILKVKDNNKAILTYLNVKDTIRDDNLTTLNRDKLYAAVTPQCGSYEILKDSYEKSFKDGLSFTDDIAVIQKYHNEIKIDLVLANDEVFKVTTPIDFKLAKLIVGDLK